MANETDTFVKEGGYGNYVLYRMCAEQPMHTNVQIVGDKIWIIGTSYACDVRRGAGELNTKDENFLYKIARTICKESVDEWLKSVRDINDQELTMANIEHSLKCHKQVMSLLMDLTRLNRRSFVSKYLHFHVPNAFFIYDSTAHKKVWEETKGMTISNKRPRGYDNVYADFCIRCLYYRDEVLKEKISPRAIDMKLLPLVYQY